ncbi:MFS family permease [Planomicrobium stackebrandtii]|uniref:MFS family permease n=1 Tax=Planomicrobium stackebrandtii TaxID=253160 RepID=A0ABU0GSB7_9BACL|nr:MFS transporter [Planomicrobium stackebrandtii]MDQ0427641.1 MFS family permease [Planomicrobium stackebrandtii]
MITRHTVISLGISQLVCWGISYYLIAAFGARIAEELGWGEPLVYGGFSAALIIMAVTSPLTGLAIDRFGGKIVMTAGSLMLAIGCGGIALSYSIEAYYLSWMMLGFAMRLCLYDAAFAALARIGGVHAKRPISQITLLGGLASTVFWPIGFFLAETFGWRVALMIYALFALLTIPLHLSIPTSRFGDQTKAADVKQLSFPSPSAATAREQWAAGSLYALIFTLLNFLNSAMSTHMITLLAGLGLTAALSVWISTLRGIGQSFARVCEVLFGARLHPISLTILASLFLPVGFIFGLFSGQFLAAALLFAFLFGAGNGLMTITRGTLPLVLFDHKTYGSLVGKLLVPGFLLSAISPIVYTYIIQHYGEQTALVISAALSFVIFALSLLLKSRFYPTAAKQ